MVNRKLFWMGLMVILIAVVVPTSFKVISGEMGILVVLSESMKPLLQVGDLLIFERISADDVKIGDFLVFRDPMGRDNVLITHMVINKTYEGFQTKGYACEEPDQFIVKPKDIVGKVIFRIPYLGYLLGFRYLQKLPRLMVFFSLMTPMAIIVSYEIKNIFTDPINKRKNEKRKKKTMKRKRRRGLK